MIKSKLLSGSILLFLCWGLFFLVFKVGGIIVHLMLLISAISLITHIYSRKTAFKH